MNKKFWILLTIQFMMPSNYSWARSDSFMPNSCGFEDTEVSKYFLGKEVLSRRMHVCTQLSSNSNVGRLMENKNMLSLPGIEKSTIKLTRNKYMHVKIPTQESSTQTHLENMKAIKTNSRVITNIFPWTLRTWK